MIYPVEMSRGLFTDHEVGSGGQTGFMASMSICSRGQGAVGSRSDRPGVQWSDWIDVLEVYSWIYHSKNVQKCGGVGNFCAISRTAQATTKLVCWVRGFAGPPSQGSSSGHWSLSQGRRWESVVCCSDVDVIKLSRVSTLKMELDPIPNPLGCIPLCKRIMTIGP